MFLQVNDQMTINPSHITMAWVDSENTIVIEMSTREPVEVDTASKYHQQVADMLNLSLHADDDEGDISDNVDNALNKLINGDTSDDDDDLQISGRWEVRPDDETGQPARSTTPNTSPADNPDDILGGIEMMIAVYQSYLDATEDTINDSTMLRGYFQGQASAYREIIHDLKTLIHGGTSDE